MNTPITTTEERDALAWLQVGSKNTGKTQFTLQMMADMATKQGKPTLILDINNQSQYDGMRPIDLDEIELFNRVAAVARKPYFRCRIETEAEIDLFFTFVHLYVKNAFVVFEDCSSYMDGNLSQPKRTLILNSRNACNDLLFNGHSLGDMAPFLHKHVEMIVLRQTGDEIGSLPGKVRNKHRVRALMAEIMEENEALYAHVRYKLAFRLLDMQSL